MNTSAKHFGLAVGP